MAPAPDDPAHDESGLLTWRELGRRLVDWWRYHLPRTLLVSAVSFGLGWLLNVYVIAFRYDGFDKGYQGATATSAGNFWNGFQFWSLLSMVLFAVIGYGFQAGWRRMFREMAQFPVSLGTLFTGSGAVGWSLFAWSAALTLLVSGLVTPAVAGVVGLGILLAAPSALSGLVGRALTGMWAGLLGLLAPNQRNRPRGLAASVIASVGAAAGTVAAFLEVATAVRLVLAGLAVFAAYWLAARPAAVPAAAVLVAIAAGLAVYELVQAVPALADDGGYSEFGGGGFTQWLQWEPTRRVMGLSVGGGIAAGSGAFVGSAVGGIVGTLPPPPLDPSVPGTPPPPGPPPPGGPYVDPDTGDVMPVQDGSYDDAPMGYVWYGEWLPPEEAARRIEDRRFDIEADRVYRQQVAAWRERNRIYEAERRRRILADQARARAERERRRQALDYVRKATQATIRRSGVARYDQAYDSIAKNAYNDDGSLNVEYVDRLRRGLGNMLRRDMQIPDESLRHDWFKDFASRTWNDARHNAFIRIGAGALSLGQSEWYYQTQAAYDAMERQSHQGELTFVDGVRIATTTLAHENLPITTVSKLASGEEVGVLDVVGDVLKGYNVRNQARATKAEYFPDENGLVAWQRRAIQKTSNDLGVDMQFRKVNPGAPKTKGLPGKEMWMKQKSINADDVKYLGYSKNQLGHVPAGPPPRLTGFRNADEYRAALAHYNKRLAEWKQYGGPTREALANGTIASRNGACYQAGPGGKAYVSDLDPADMTRGGRRLSDAEVVKVMNRLEEQGIASGSHGTPHTWDAKTPKEIAIKQDLIAKLPDDAGEWIRSGGTAGARPRWTPGAVGAGVHDMDGQGP